VPVATLQTGVEPPHIALLFAEQTPHAPLGWQAGVAPPHSLSPLHPRQVRKAGSQTGVAPLQSDAARQPTQIFAEVSQTGVGAAHVALVTHSTHTPAGTLHAGVEPLQCVLFVAEHWPQAPDVRQADVAPEHSPSPAQARHTWLPESQVGLVPLQSADARQPTHSRGEAVVRQNGAVPLQSALLAQPSTTIGVGGAP
jgi:hypothetical protein